MLAFKMTNGTNEMTGEMTGNVVFDDDVRGELWPELLATEGGAEYTRIRLEDGRQITIPTYLIIAQSDGTYRVRRRTTDINQIAVADSASDMLQSPNEEGPAIDSEIIIPVVEEFAQVEKQVIGTGHLRVTTKVTARDEIIDEPLSRTTASIERIPVSRLVDAVPEPRHEGDTLVISVVEEVLVIEKRLMLVEEVHITQRTSEYHAPQTVTLRRTEVSTDQG